ncbi:MAG: alpha/beta hydrolase [Lyngbya sp. HA4199-MV5]|jgi:pimeloyl-ACP methyl ester carboxylesterase|nr:alpha/beta hydrolase [Lyngbya sp. HA4199-MV5]
MIASFLSPESARLTEPTSIALAQSIDRIDLLTPLCAGPISTAYVRQGSGSTPILLLHGFDSSVFEFRRLLPLLTEQQETWSVDLLGFGFTDRPVNLSFNPVAIKSHLYAFWKANIARPMILVGASMGGAAAIDFALIYPEAVEALVLIDSAGFARGPAISRFLFPPLGELATSFLRSPKVRRNVSLQAYADPSFVTPDSLLCAALHLQCPHWQQAIISFTKSGGYNFLADRTAAINHPTLILWGDSDRILGTQDAEKFHRAIAHSKLVWINHCGHVPHLEKPEETAEQILAFCA